MEVEREMEIGGTEREMEGKRVRLKERWRWKEREIEGGKEEKGGRDRNRREMDGAGKRH